MVNGTDTRTHPATAPSERHEAAVGIVGAGPAGARAAELLAARGIEVVIWDPRAPWEKPCGGGLTAALVHHVPELLELGHRLAAIGRVRFTTSRGAAIDLVLQEPIRIVSRLELARWQLARAERAGAALVRDQVRRIARTGDAWAVHTASGREWRVRWLLGADGAASLVRAAAAPDFRVGLEPTRVAYVPTANGGARDIVLRFTRGVAGYAWDFPRPDHRSVGSVVEPGGASRAQLDGDVDALWSRAEIDTGADETAVIRAGAVIGSALLPWRHRGGRVGAADFALVGDAAGLADPGTGEGITNAFRSAELAAEAFSTTRGFARYPARLAKRLEPEFRHARLLRRLLYEHHGAVRLIERATASEPLYALATSLLDSANAHRTAILSPWLWGLARGHLRGGRRAAAPREAPVTPAATV